MDYASYPATSRITCNKLLRIGPTGSVRSLSQTRMRTSSARFNTFANWRPGSNGSPPPEALASSGFVYRGMSDQTQCFSCLLVLSQWLPVHDPDIEHHRYSPDCEFLLSRYNNFDNNLRLSPTPTPTLPSPSVNTDDVVTEPSTVSITNPTEASLCKICYTHNMDILFRPCGHLLSCRSCANKFTSCPLCRSPIIESIRAFVSFQ